MQNMNHTRKFRKFFKTPLRPLTLFDMIIASSDHGSNEPPEDAESRDHKTNLPAL